MKLRTSSFSFKKRGNWTQWTLDPAGSWGGGVAIPITLGRMSLPPSATLSESGTSRAVELVTPVPIWVRGYTEAA